MCFWLPRPVLIGIRDDWQSLFHLGSFLQGQCAVPKEIISSMCLFNLKNINYNSPGAPMLIYLKRQY